MKHQHMPPLSRKDKEKRRLKAAKLFEQGKTQAEVARTFNVTTAATNVWYATWEKGGTTALKSKGHPGFVSTLSSTKRQAFRKAILKGPQAFGYETDLWTLSRLKAVMKKVNRLDFSEVWIWHIVRNLGFTPQKPQVKAKQRDEQAIKRWKEQALPDLKKMG